MRRDVDSILNAGQGACYLKDERVARIVQDALKHFHGDHYELIGWAIMPNHVHVVVRPLGNIELPEILHSWKSLQPRKPTRCSATADHSGAGRVLRSLGS